MNQPTGPQGVTVRYWAGARHAAGVIEETVPAGSLQAALDEVLGRHDAAFARVLSVCSFVVGEQPVGARPTSTVVLRDGDVVEVLPPFAGGTDAAAPAESAAPGEPAAAGGRSAAAVLAVAAGLALAVAAELTGEPGVWVMTILLQLPLLLGWHRGLGVAPAAGGIAAGAVVAAAADVVGWVSDDATLAPLAGVVGAGFLLGVVQQLARRDHRTGVAAGLAATTTLSFLVAGLASWPMLVRLPDGKAVALAAGVAVAAASLARLTGALPVAVAMAPGLGFIAGLVVGGLVDGILVTTSAVLGVVVALPVLLADVMDRRDPRLVRAAWPAAAVWPFALAAPLAYAVARLLP